MYIPSYSSSKFIDFLKMRKDLMCFVISSCLLAGQFPDCWMFSLSSSLLVWSNVHWWIRWSTVWSSLLQGHVALSINLNRWRYALVLSHRLYLCTRLVSGDWCVRMTGKLVWLLREMLGYWKVDGCGDFYGWCGISRATKILFGVKLRTLHNPIVSYQFAISSIFIISLRRLLDVVSFPTEIWRKITEISVVGVTPNRIGILCLSFHAS